MSAHGQYVAVARADEIEPGTARRVEVNGVGIAVVNCNGRFYAVDDICSHALASLSEGEVWEDECTIECPLHGSSFSLETGQPLTLPAVTPVKTYPVVVENGEVRVAGG